MSYANGTQFYNLPQTVGTDKRDWFDTNSAFAAIDAALHSAVTGQASDAEAIATINGKLATDEADIAALQTKTNTHDNQIAALQTTVNTQANQISDVRQDAEDMITANNEGAAATSTKAYAIGDYFIYNDVLYKATAAIAVGDTIVPNTNCKATNVDTELTQVNNDLSSEVSSINNTLTDLETAYNFVEILASSAGGGGPITLSKSIKDYAMVRFENSNFGLTEVVLYDAQPTLRLSTMSMSGSILVLCIAEFTISDDGKTLTPNYQVQVNIESTGVTLFNTSATYTWNVVGLKQIESVS